MKSAQIKKYGGSEVIEINQSTSEPTVSTGKVLVIIKAAGVNPVDWKIREGGMQQLISLQFPSTLGMDFSGVIKQVGEGVSPADFKQGDEVYGQAGVISGGSGAFAEMALANTESIANKPKRLSHAEAAALPLVGVSAWQALAEDIELSKGQKILIHGGAGGIGSIAIQLAKNLGAYVATTVSANDKQFVQELGADVVIDYKTQTFEDLLHDYDAVFDTVGGETYKRSFRVLKKGGIIVSMLEQPNSGLMNQYDIKAIFRFTQVNRERLTKLAQWVDQNNIRVNVEKKFSLDEAGDALDYQKDVHPRGKVVLAM
ncbi:MAG TPA: NADP-dependent oxidoreductase [Nitrososphaeraceae archaeon]|nr:NADP-dependent oxidoreductase [Nitrososphaeraceae archaeon]